MNGPLKFLSARKILPLLDLLAKFKRVLACSCSPNFFVARKLAIFLFLLVLAKKSQCSACSQRPFVTPSSAFSAFHGFLVEIQANAGYMHATHATHA